MKRLSVPRCTGLFASRFVNVGESQERFKQLIATIWGPALRELGFKGSGRAWTLTDSRDWVMLGFQTSTSSTSAETKFTMNLLVVGKDAWSEALAERPYIGAKPNPNVISVYRVQERAGLLTHGTDHWWRLAGNGSNEREIAQEILSAIRNVIVPALKNEIASPSPQPQRS